MQTSSETWKTYAMPTSSWPIGMSLAIKLKQVSLLRIFFNVNIAATTYCNLQCVYLLQNRSESPSKKVHGQVFESRKCPSQVHVHKSCDVVFEVIQ